MFNKNLQNILWGILSSEERKHIREEYFYGGNPNNSSPFFVDKNKVFLTLFGFDNIKGITESQEFLVCRKML